MVNNFNINIPFKEVLQTAWYQQKPNVFFTGSHYIDLHKVIKIYPETMPDGPIRIYLGNGSEDYISCPREMLAELLDAWQKIGGTKWKKV